MKENKSQVIQKQFCGKIVESNTNEDIWTIGRGSAMVRVNYNWLDEVVTVGVIPAVSNEAD